jgi:hypothetical protein
LVFGLGAIGISFRQACKAYQVFKEKGQMRMLGAMSDVKVAQLCRIVCAVNLQSLKEIEKKAWAFSIGIDS